MKKERVMTPRGEVIAIGEFKIRNSPEFPYEIPRLSYITIQDSENTYASTCIDLHIDGDGTTSGEAEKNMGENVFEFLCVNFAENRSKNPAWNYLKELVTLDENSIVLWNAFNYFKLNMANKGLKTDFASDLMERVSTLKGEIARLTKLDTTKEKEITLLREWLSKQIVEIDRLNQEKQMIQEAARLTFQTLGNFENYNTSWIKKR